MGSKLDSGVKSVQQANPGDFVHRTVPGDAVRARSRIRARAHARHELSRALIVWIAAYGVLSSQGRSQGTSIGLATIAAVVFLPFIQWAARSARAMPLLFGVWIVAGLGAAAGFAGLSAVSFWIADGFTIQDLSLIAIITFVATGLWDKYIGRPATAPMRVALVGGDERIAELVEDIERSEGGADFNVVGAATESITPSPSERDFPVVELDDLEALIMSTTPDLVVVAVEHGRPTVFSRLLAAAYHEDFNVIGLPEFYEVAFGRLPIRALTPAWFMSTLHFYNRPYNRIAKRLFDVFASILLLILALPILPIAVLVVARTPGPVLYRQQRLGEHGQLFEILKFRSMRLDAETGGTAVFATENDSRVIPGGKLLRRLRIDEIPQLWNVLRGEMSVVGPRPERPEFLSVLADEVPYWTQRNLMKPGITGWAQIRAGYASDSMGAEAKLSYDLWYLRHRSLGLDSIICLKTVATVLTGSGSR